MAALLGASLTFPALIFTGVLALALIYWLFVILGALDLDVLGGAEGAEGADIDGMAKGALEGAVKGSLEGAVKGSLEGAAKGATEGLADVDGADEGGLSDLMASLHLNRAPATVVLTLLAAFGWLTSVLALMNLSDTWAGWGLPGWLFKGVVLIVAFVVALPLTSLAVRPLGPFFATHAAQSNKDLIGRVVVISTGRVDNRFGQATLADGGAGLILDVRCDTPGLLRQGDRVVLVRWDDDREAFEVEPIEADLAERRFKKLEGEPAAGGMAPAETAAEDDAQAEARGQSRAG